VRKGGQGARSRAAGDRGDRSWEARRPLPDRRGRRHDGRVDAGARSSALRRTPGNEIVGVRFRDPRPGLAGGRRRDPGGDRRRQPYVALDDDRRTFYPRAARPLLDGRHARVRRRARGRAGRCARSSRRPWPKGPWPGVAFLHRHLPAEPESSLPLGRTPRGPRLRGDRAGGLPTGSKPPRRGARFSTTEGKVRGAGGRPRRRRSPDFDRRRVRRRSTGWPLSDRVRRRARARRFCPVTARAGHIAFRGARSNPAPVAPAGRALLVPDRPARRQRLGQRTARRRVARPAPARSGGRLLTIWGHAPTPAQRRGEGGVTSCAPGSTPAGVDYEVAASTTRSTPSAATSARRRPALRPGRRRDAAVRGHDRAARRTLRAPRA